MEPVPLHEVVGALALPREEMAVRAEVEPGGCMGEAGLLPLKSEGGLGPA